MPQFRLTAKMAKELKIDNLAESQTNLPNLYDDWYVDIIRIQRKKVVVFMHIDTRIALAMPIFEIGGMKYIFNCFAIALRELLYEINFDQYESLANKALEFFDVPEFEYIFCKTQNKSVTTHLTQFKFVLEHDIAIAGEITQSVCDKTAEYWLSGLIKDPENPKKYSKPIELLERYFDRESGSCIESKNQTPESNPGNFENAFGNVIEMDSWKKKS
jgi:hypothetical protein